MSKISTLISTQIAEIFGSSIEAQNKKIYMAKALDNVKLNDLFPKSVVPPQGVQSFFHQRIAVTNFLEEACLILVPHEWCDIQKNQEYLRYLRGISLHLPILIFNTGDMSPPVTLKNTIQIRTFLHPGEKNTRKILVPYPVNSRRFKLRDWNPIPRVGFMGQVPKLRPGSLISRPKPDIRYPLKSSVYLSRKLSIVRLRRLEPGISVDLVIRPRFTAIHKNYDLAEHSQEFQDQLFNCDYILCPRGFGNTSMRFYEALSAGNTPILVNTEGGLPELNEGQDWNNHILSVNLNEDWKNSILRDWQILSKGENYQIRQLSNLKMFNSLLSFDSYMKQLFLNFIEYGG